MIWSVRLTPSSGDFRWQLPAAPRSAFPSQVVILVEDRLEKLEEIRNRTTAELTGTQEELGRCRRSTAGSVPARSGTRGSAV